MPSLLIFNCLEGTVTTVPNGWYCRTSNRSTTVFGNAALVTASF